MAAFPTPSIRRIHEQLLHEAEDHVAEQKWDNAIQDLSRLLALRPHASLEVRGRWLLGEAYIHSQEWEKAREQYQALVSMPSPHRYQQDAKKQLLNLEGKYQGLGEPPGRTQAIRMTLEQLPTAGGFEEGIKRMKGDGVTTLLLDLGCRAKVVRANKGADSPQVFSSEHLHRLIKRYVARSHLQELHVFLGVNLRCLGHWKRSAPSEWKDQTFDVRSGKFVANEYFDVFHPEYQRFVKHFLGMMIQSGLDGVVFLKDHPMGLRDGVSASGLQGFQSVFGVAFQPEKVFSRGFDPIRALRHPKKSSGKPQPSSERTVFWRWIGWKAREQIGIKERIMTVLLQNAPQKVFGVELHPHGLTDPARALLAYSEDSLEAMQRPFSFFFVRPEIDRSSTFEEPSVTEKLRRISTNAVLKRLLPALEDPRKIWLSVPSRAGYSIQSRTTSKKSSFPQTLPTGIGVVHDLRTFS